MTTTFGRNKRHQLVANWVEPMEGGFDSFFAAELERSSFGQRSVAKSQTPLSIRDADVKVNIYGTGADTSLSFSDGNQGVGWSCD